MATQFSNNPETPKDTLDKRFESVSWGLLLLLAGIVWLLPGWPSSGNILLIGAGIILLGVNWVRSQNGIKMHSFSLILGILALAGGLAGFLGVNLPLFALFLILVGAFILLGPMFGQTMR